MQSPDTTGSAFEEHGSAFKMTNGKAKNNSLGQ